MLDKINSIKHDKLLHFFTGSLVTFVLSPFIGLYALAVIAIIAIGKEVYDGFHDNHTRDVWDALWSIFGGVIGMGNCIYVV